MTTCNSSLFGNKSQYIKVNGGDLVAIEGSNTLEKMILSDLRIPYKQILKGRIILKPGQINYLFNFLSLGDNATFLCIKATYDIKSVVETDNYISWSYYDDLSRINHFAQWMVLTGNSSNRVPQLYLTNPSTKWPVTLEVMVGVIDDTYTFFSDVIDQTGTSFIGLEYTDIHTYVVGESIVINDKSVPARPLIYIILNNINSIEINTNILIIDDSSNGLVFLQFLTEFDARQAHSLINYVLENPNVVIDNLNPVEDITDPIVYFYSNVGNTQSGDYIYFNGSSAGVPYNTTSGFTFSTSISMSTFGTSSGTLIDKQQLINLLVGSASDNRDGEMVLMPSNIIISGTSGYINSILNIGTYSMTFDFSDIAQNYLDGIIINLDIIN